MRTEPYGDGVRIIMENEKDVEQLDALMVGTDNPALYRFLETTLEGNLVSEIVYPSDGNGQFDMVSKYMNWFVLRLFTPILRPYGRSISILYLVASPSLQRRLDTMLQPPHRAEHKAYVEEIVRPSINVNPAPAAARRKKSRKVKRRRRTTFRRKY
jgi:hypothetical protein